jgi:hypothetical protein
LGNAQSLDTPVHQGSTENTTEEPGTNSATIPETVRVKREGAAKMIE